MSVNKGCPEHSQYRVYQGSQLWEDFYSYTSGSGPFTTLSSGGGTTALSTTEDWAVCTTGAGNADYQGVATTQPLFLFAPGVSHYAEFYFNTANLTDPAIFMGFSSAPGSTYNSVSADPTGSCSSAVAYFLQGATYASFTSSNGSAHTIQQSYNVPFANGTVNPAVNHLVRIDVVNWDGLNCQVVWTVDGITPLDVNGLEIVQKVPYASLAQMKVFFQVTSGGSADVASCDFITAGKYRQLMT